MEPQILQIKGEGRTIFAIFGVNARSVPLKPLSPQSSVESA